LRLNAAALRLACLLARVAWDGVLPGHWEAWIAFFLEGVSSAAAEAERSIISVASLVAADRCKLLESPRSSPRAIAFLRCCR
jgi:hypothetical protein